MATLGWICGIGALVCSILVGVQAIKRKQVALGVLSILCTLVGLIVGWMKAGEWGIRNLMIVFTILFVLYLILTGAGGGFRMPSPTGV